VWCTCTGGAAAQAVKTTPVTVSAAAAPAAPCGVVNCTQRRSLRTIGRYHPYGSWSCCIVPPARCGDSLFCARDCRCPLSACYYVRELRSGARSDLMEFGGYCRIFEWFLVCKQGKFTPHCLWLWCRRGLRWSGLVGWVARDLAAWGSDVAVLFVYVGCALPHIRLGRGHVE